MPLALQILVGSAVLVLCGVFHIAILMRLLRLRAYSGSVPDERLRGHFRLIITVFLVITLSHVAQIFLWALVIWFSGGLASLSEAFYFAMVSYTTTGYGDVVLGPDYRTLGAMSAIAGILAFGLSTALIVALFTRLLGGLPSPDR
jgi:hypothetical protein